MQTVQLSLSIFITSLIWSGVLRSLACAEGAEFASFHKALLSKSSLAWYQHWYTPGKFHVAHLACKQRLFLDSTGLPSNLKCIPQLLCCDILNYQKTSLLNRWLGSKWEERCSCWMGMDLKSTQWWSLLPPIMLEGLRLKISGGGSWKACDAETRKRPKMKELAQWKISCSIYNKTHRTL